MDDAIDISDCDPHWAAEFDRTAAALRAALPHDLSFVVEHFGSTAVPGLDAKAVIDILILVADTSRWDELDHALSALGFALWHENPDSDRLLFIRREPGTGRRSHHVHVRTPGDAERELRFRDLLRSKEAIRRDYAKLKRSLAERFRHDRAGYSDGKTAFIEEALRKDEL